MELKNYLKDGADYQSRATLMFLQKYVNIEKSWNDEYQKYDAEITIARWENINEQGYVVSLINENKKQLNIAFFEQRNCGVLCAVKWHQESVNALTIDTAEFGDSYKDKYDTSHSVGYGEADEMAKWIIKELTQHWIN